MNGPSGMGGPSLFESASIQTIQGGTYQAIHGSVHNTVNVHNQLLPNHDPNELAETVKLLQKLAIDLVDYRNIHQDIIDNKTPNTGETFKTKEEVQRWLQYEIRVLWVTGGPGTGKTYLASSFVDQLEARAEESTQGGVAVICLYLRFSETLTEWDIVVSVIIQLVQWSEQLPAVAAAVRKVFNRRGPRKDSRPSFGDLIKLLKEIISLFHEVEVIIDGIDEMTERIQWLIAQTITSTKAYVLFTSRPIQFVEEKLKEANGDQLVIVDFVAPSEDLDLFIGGAINEYPSLSALLKDNNAKEGVMNKIKEKASGMFLHASLQVELLRHCRNMYDIDQAIDQFPPSIADLYARTLQRIPSTDIALAHSALIWLLQVKGTITIADLRHAIAVSPETYRFEPRRLVSEHNIISICRGLVTIEKQTRQIRLVHYTAYEALSNLLSSYTPHPEVVIARTCIARLADCGFQRSTITTSPELIQSFADTPLLEYSYRNASHHINKGLQLWYGLKAIVDDFIQLCESFPYLPLEAIEGTYQHPPQMLKPLHVAALFGQARLVFQLVVESGVDVNLQAGYPTGNGWTSLSIAALEGHDSVVEVLLDLPGAAINPFASAVEDEQEVSSAVDDETQVRDIGGTPLILACARGHERILERLLEAPGIDVNGQDSDGDTALIVASFVGSPAVVKTLLTVRDIDINQIHADGWTALMIASYKGHTAIVEALINTPGVDINLVSEDGDSSSLILASLEGHVDVVKVLVGAAGIDVNQPDHDGWTPLTHALEEGHDGVVKVLVHSPGIDINRVDDDGETALSRASGNGNIAVIKALLEAPGIDVNLVNEDGDPPLLLATEEEDQAAVEALLATVDIDVNRPNSYGCTPLMDASGGGHDGILGILLSAPGIKVNQTDDDGETALMVACQGGNIAAVKALLNHPATDANLTNGDGTSSLFLASSFGHEDVVKALLSTEGIQLNQQTDQGWSALTRAAYKGHILILELLLARPEVDLNLRTAEGDTIILFVLSYHLQKYHTESVHQVDLDPQPIALLLLDRPDVQAFAHIPNNEGWTPLMMASRFGYSAVVERLLGLATTSACRI